MRRFHSLFLVGLVSIAGLFLTSGAALARGPGGGGHGGGGGHFGGAHVGGAHFGGASFGHFGGAVPHGGINRGFAMPNNSRPLVNNFNRPFIHNNVGFNRFGNGFFFPFLGLGNFWGYPYYGWGAGYNYGIGGYYNYPSYGGYGGYYDSSPYYYNNPYPYPSYPQPYYYDPSQGYTNGSTYRMDVINNTAPRDNRAHVHVTLPTPDAQLLFEGQKTSTTGSQRDFDTPALSPGSDYSYTITAKWSKDGQTVTQERHVAVHAGQNVVVDFTRAAQTATPQATPSEQYPVSQTGGTARR